MLTRIRTAPLDRIYLLLCTPILLALVYVLPPFQCPDETVPLPIPLAISAIAALAIAFTIGGSEAPPRMLRWFAVLVVLAGAGATFLFLYIQNTAVGGGYVTGYQGRYLLPILPALLLIIPRWTALRGRRENQLYAFVVVATAVGAIATLLFLALRSWG